MISNYTSGITMPYLIDSSMNKLIYKATSVLFSWEQVTQSPVRWVTYSDTCASSNVQDKVYTEIMENVGKDGRARYEERNNFPYTFAMMMEAQRFGTIAIGSEISLRILVGVAKPAGDIKVRIELFISFHCSTQLQILVRFLNNLVVSCWFLGEMSEHHRLGEGMRAAGNIPVNGYIIPKGAEICANLWAMHYDPNYWDQPEVFRPERFLTPDGKALIKHPKSYVPFSVGKRNCPGERIAWMAILFYFTEIIKKFEISTPRN
ncbi:methyl farnesoate epoxidase [Caerostris extrusa]|uniref:Methyl farnesoate epoxidase n=1 Tax=Caerostris extrusa TaxID=172846 RepID=A0AAV4X9U2_CAEEX|nr:methyl farnesoate epoxidase [Caerostris extrusa]